MKLYREHNPSLADPKHLNTFFQQVIGESACMSKMLGATPEDKTPQQVESETLCSIQEFCEQNGKPCCINLITEGDLKFLKSLEPVPEEPPKEEG